jgi:hypothetical protein
MIEKCYPGSCTRHRGYFPVEVPKASDFHRPTPSSVKLKVFISELPMSLFTCIPYFIMIFKIDYDEENYYFTFMCRLSRIPVRLQIL